MVSRDPPAPPDPTLCCQVQEKGGGGGLEVLPLSLTAICFVYPKQPGLTTHGNSKVWAYQPQVTQPIWP